MILKPLYWRSLSSGCHWLRWLDFSACLAGWLTCLPPQSLPPTCHTPPLSPSKRLSFVSISVAAFSWESVMPRSRSLSHCSRRLASCPPVPVPPRFCHFCHFCRDMPPPPPRPSAPPRQSVCLVCQTATEKQLNASLPVKIGIKAKTMIQ